MRFIGQALLNITASMLVGLVVQAVSDKPAAAASASAATCVCSCCAAAVKPF